jgi:hypothetical protein
MQTDLRHAPERRSRARGAWLSLVILVVSGCTAGSGASPSQPNPDDAERPSRTTPLTPTVPPTAAPVTGEVPDELMDDILDEVVDRTGVAIAELEVVRAEFVTWDDGSLGCPEPDQAYTQALVDGYHVVVSAGGEELDFRATTAGNFVLCENPGPDRPGG